MGGRWSGRARLVAILLLALALKAGILAAGAVPFSADEAVVALMARHILQGERPVFFYGQAYLGSLDAWLVAGAFRLMGESVLAVRLVQAALYLLTIATTYQLGRAIYGDRWIARTAALFMAAPTVLVTLYTTASLGGYGETLLIGNLLFLLALRVGRACSPPPTVSRYKRDLLVGLLGGLGFWTFPLILVYLLPAAVLLLWARRARRDRIGWALAGAGFILGAAPWLRQAIAYGLPVLAESGGAAIAGASAVNPALAVIQHLFNLVVFGLTVIAGLRPPWSARLLALPLAPLALAMYAALALFVVVRAVRAKDGARAGRWLLLSSMGLLVMGFALTPFGADPSGRYFLPLAAPLALFMSEMLHALRTRLRERGWLANALALGLAAFNLWGTAESAARFPPGLTTQFDAVAQMDQRAMPELIAFLHEHGETRGYSNYWVTFPLVFLSREELIFAARLPYHLDFHYTPRDDRYAPYTRAVEASPRAAYITTRHPPLDARLREGLARLGVTFEEEQIGDFHVFYALSRKVTPEELELGSHRE